MTVLGALTAAVLSITLPRLVEERAVPHRCDTAACRPATAPVPRQADLAEGPAWSGEDAAELLRHFAMNAFVGALMDDNLPPRWTELAIVMNCPGGAQVFVDGEPIRFGAPVPAKAFQLRWEMAGCDVLDASGVAVVGTLVLDVYHEERGLSAMVHPVNLRLHAYDGVRPLSGTFSATMGW